MLPADLRSAEAELLPVLQAALAADPRGRWTVELRFEGLRPMPVVLRLLEALSAGGRELRLLFPDAGASALARRDAPGQAGSIASFGDQRRRQQDAPGEELLLLAGASQAEYEEVEALCGDHRGPVVLVNPALEDAAVGIGSVARQRRRGFLSTLKPAYALIPLPGGALRRSFPSDWELYRLDSDGYRFTADFERKPDGEQIEAALGGNDSRGLGGNLRALDQLLEGLQN
jgi:hypothetical protein